MKPNLLARLTLISAVVLFAYPVAAQTFTTLHSFTARSGSSFTNTDGCCPLAGLILSNNTLYGTASAGGRSGNGSVFKVNTDGTGYTTLHSFTALAQTYYTNS